MGRKGTWFASPTVRVLSGDNHKPTRDRNGKPQISHAHVITCDMTATNGNVLEIDSVLLGRHRPDHWRFNPFSMPEFFNPRASARFYQPRFGTRSRRGWF